MDAERRHIDAFLAVARLGSFTRAATHLGVSQPALTVQVRQLEAALGVRLFDRNNRRVAITAAGRELAPALERVAADLDAILGQARDLASHRRGVVTVAALPSVAADLLPRAIARLAAEPGGLVVRVRDATAGRIADLVRSGEADVGIGTLFRPDPELAATPLLVDRLAAFAPSGHRLAGRRSLALRELSGLPLILTSPDSSVRQVVEAALAAARLPAHVVQEATYMTTALGMVRAGLGVAVLPTSAAGLGMPGVTRPIAVRAPVLEREIVLLTRAGRSASPAAEHVLATLRRLAGRRGEPRGPA